MDTIKVCLLCRVSTSKQDYDYQVAALTEIADSRGWEVIGIFANKISGARKNEERQEIMEMLEFIVANRVDKIMCTEISRLGRSTLEALKVIEMLNEKKICLYLANYGIETLNERGEVNPTCRFLCTILLEVAQMERGMIRSRMQMGYRDYLNRRRVDKDAHPLGRPASYRKSDDEYKTQYQKEISLLRKGISLRNVSKLTHTSVGTLQRLKKYL